MFMMGLAGDAEAGAGNLHARRVARTASRRTLFLI